LSTNVLPVAIATGNIHIGTMAGKLNGADDPATDARAAGAPRSRSMPPEAFSVADSPLSSVRDAAGELDDLEAALHLALRRRLSTLPCSSVISAASSGARASSSSRKRNRIWVRLVSEVSRQAGNAAFAAAITTAASSALARGRCAVTSPVAGSVTSDVRPEVPSTRAPATQWWSVFCSVLVMVLFFLSCSGAGTGAASALRAS
jgi:hypothetical protein